MAGRWRSPEYVLAAALGLAAAALAASCWRPGGAAAARELRGAIPAPGLGRAADLSRCACAFDPRVDGTCGLRHGALPGSGALCPDHALPAGEGER